MTYEDYLAFPDDSLRRELIAGEVFVTPSPNARHQRVVFRLAFSLEAHLRGHGGGEVFIPPFDVVLSEHDVVQPDVIFVAEADAGIVGEANIRGVPTLVAEVVSDPRTDRVRKRRLYEQVGVPEYWVIDPDSDRVEVYRLAGGRYAKPEILEPGETLTTGLVRGFSLDVAGLLGR